GSYVLRYILDAPDGRKLLTSIPLAITEARGSVALPPEAPGGSELSVNFTGPAGPGDYLDIVPEDHTDLSGELAYYYVERSPDGETGTMIAPGNPGPYKVRYIMDSSNGRRLLA